MTGPLARAGTDGNVLALASLDIHNLARAVVTVVGHRDDF